MMCEFLGRPEIAADPRYAGRERLRLAGEIGEAFAEALQERSAEEVFHEGQAWRVPFGLVPSMAQIVELLPHRERGFMVSVEHPIAGTVKVPGVPYVSTATEARPTRPPMLGEHNREILEAAEPAVEIATSRVPDSAVPSPLAGLRVLDLSMWFSGPLVTQILGDAGADIIKVESVQRIDGWRGAALANVERAWERSPNFNWVNRSKRGITLNLADPRGVELVKRLVADADVVIENYTPRVMGNFGLEYETLRLIKPDLIMMSMPGFGSNVSWRDYVAFGMSTEQMAGFSHLTGYDGGPPIFTGTNGGDPFVGVVGAITVVSALHHRERTGEGQHIDLSQVEACTLFVGDAIAGWTLAGVDPGRTGNAHHARAPHGIYQCRDHGWIAIDCQDDAQWATLAALIGHSDWATEVSPCAVVEGRLKERSSLDEAIAAWTRSQGHIELAETLQGMGVAAGAVLSGPELLADAHLQARGAFIVQDRDLVGPAHYPGQPHRFRFAAPAPNRRAPYLGEHSNEVLRERLGLGDEELTELEAADITGSLPMAAR